jgi:carbon monoxide dehydrogenase subunit G
MVGVGSDTFAATLGVQVGPMADTYRGTFTVSSTPTGLRVAVEARGRCGRLELDLRTHLGTSCGGTRLRYVADAHVRGLVARLGTPTLTVVGGHLTHTFFRDLERALSTRQVPALV